MAYEHFSRRDRKIIAREIEKESRRFGEEMVPLRLELAHLASFAFGSRAQVKRVFRNRRFLAVVYDENGQTRLSVCRTAVEVETGRFLGGISWDELQAVKSACGFGESWAVEVYPADSSVVDVANMRHLWILPAPPAFAWMNPEVRPL